jgi:hypothetical protein
MSTKISGNFWEVDSSTAFEKLALETFRHQHQNNRVYRSYCDLIHCDPSGVDRVEKIPYLPITFFKTHRVCSFEDADVSYFSSSTTGGGNPSHHYYLNTEDYEMSFRKGFEYFYGAAADYTILALLPAYLERKGSSLIYMVNDLMAQSAKAKSGFYLNQWDLLAKHLLAMERSQQKTLLIGVSFALLDFLDQHRFNLKTTIVMETGGMKGRRKELTREDLHGRLCEGFGCSEIHSEYGMTELLSQAYSKGNGLFECPPWMRVSIRENQDPFSSLPFGQTGGLNVIDLANRDSCAFIATEDLGKAHSNRQFEVLGRFDASEVRGCNLMVV